MDTVYWTRKWSDNEIGFHQDQINKRLTTYWPAVVSGNEQGKVFVPLCGKSRDMLWLHRQGHALIGVELSELAVEAFFTENHLSVKREHLDGFEVFTGQGEAQGIIIYVGDYFSLSARHLEGCTTFYDRASLIAMPESMRRDYAKQLAEIMPSGSRGLLLAIAYNQDKMKGPPFSVPDKAVHDLLGNSFSLTQLAHFDGPRTVGNLAARGLETLDERVYLLTRR